MKRRYLRVSVAILLAALFAFFATAAAQVGSTAVFRRRYHAPFASLSAFTARDPFTGQQLQNPRGLHFLFVDSPGTLQAFCVQKGMTIYDTGQITRTAHAFNDPLFSVLSATARENLLRVALFGYPNRTPAQLSTTAQQAQAATQILMWESQLGFRDAQFNRTENRLHNAYFAGGNMATVRAVVERIERDIANYLRTPTLPTQMQLTYQNGRYSHTFTEPSGVPFEINGSNPNGINIIRESDQVTLYTTQRPTHGDVLTLTRTDIPAARMDALGPPLIWIDPARQLLNQLLFTGVQPRGQSFTIQINMPVEETTTTQPTTITTAPQTTTTRHSSTTAAHTTTTRTTTTTQTTSGTSLASTTQQITTTRPSGSFPQTGDSFPVAWVVMASGAALGAWLLRKKDDRPEQ